MGFMSIENLCDKSVELVRSQENAIIPHVLAVEIVELPPQNTVLIVR